MIFGPDLLRKIAEGKKTTTRRPVKGDEPRSRYSVGKSYAVQKGRGQAASFRIVITDVRREPVGEITFEDARAEGFRTSDAFKVYWVELYDKAWVAREKRDRGLGEDDVLPEFEVVDRFEARHAHKLVWVLSFVLDKTETPRFLGASSPLAAGGKARVVSAKKKKPGRARLPSPALTEDQAAGYVKNPARALVDAGEAVSAEEQVRITERAGTETSQWLAREAAAYDAERAWLATEERIRRAVLRARLRNVDVSRELWMVQKLLKNGRAAHMVERRVEVLERKAFATGVERAA